MINTLIQEIKIRITEMIKKLRFEHYFVVFILFLSLLVKLIYVFKFTDYQHYLMSDMDGYWQRAEQRAGGKIVDQGQIAMWAPFYHYILAEIFKYISYFGLLEYKLEIVLILNIIFSTLSLIFVYLIVLNVSGNKRISSIALVLYAFNFIFIYTNAFVLTEPLAILLLLLAVYLLFVHHDKKLLVFLSGIVFALVIGLRPALGLLGISFVLYIFFAGRRNFRSIIRAALFTIGFLIIIFSILVENYHVSDGKMKSLSAHGGANFFLAQCRVKRLHTEYDGYAWGLIPPILSGGDFSRQQEFHAHTPFYNQKYFYKLGLACLKLHPENWYDNLRMVKALFWGPMFPVFAEVRWFTHGIRINNYLIFFMFVSLGLLSYPLKDKKIDIKKTLFLLSMPLWIIIIMYFYTSGQRQILPAYFAIYTLFFTLLVHIKNYEFKAIKYFVILLLVFELFQLL